MKQFRGVAGGGLGSETRIVKLINSSINKMRKALRNKSLEGRPSSAPMKEKSITNKMLKTNSAYYKKINSINLNSSFQDKKRVVSVNPRQKSSKYMISPINLRNQLNTTLLSKKELSQYLNESIRSKTPVRLNSTMSITSSKNNPSSILFPTTTQHSQFSQIALELEVQLTEKLKQINLTEASEIISQQKLEVYRGIFQKVIDRDKDFGTLLYKIKQAYEQSLKQPVSTSETQSIQICLQLQQELKQVKKSVHIEREDKKQAEKKIEFLARENLQLSKQLEEREDQLQEMSQTIQKLDKKQMFHMMTQNENNWNILVEENQNLQEICKQMQRQLKAHKKKEIQVSRLLKYLKDKGIPIEAFYEEMQKSQRSNVDSSSVSNQMSQKSSAKTQSELQTPVMSAKIKIKQAERPQCVPPLDLTKIYIQSSTDIEDDEKSYYQSSGTMQDSETSSSQNI